MASTDIIVRLSDADRHTLAEITSLVQSAVGTPDLNVGKYARFLPVAQQMATLSKYPRTKVAAIAFGPGMEIRATGWNGAPRGSDADADHRLQDREESLHWIAHAEANVIANAARSGASLDKCVLLVTHPPCMSCAKLIVQAGIRAVICPEPNEEFRSRWQEDMDRTAMLFAECSIEYISLENT